MFVGWFASPFYALKRPNPVPGCSVTTKITPSPWGRTSCHPVHPAAGQLTGSLQDQEIQRARSPLWWCSRSFRRLRQGQVPRNWVGQASALRRAACPGKGFGRFGDVLEICSWPARPGACRIASEEIPTDGDGSGVRLSHFGEILERPTNRSRRCPRCRVGVVRILEGPTLGMSDRRAVRLPGYQRNPRAAGLATAFARILRPAPVFPVPRHEPENRPVTGARSKPAGPGAVASAPPVPAETPRVGPVVDLSQDHHGRGAGRIQVSAGHLSEH